MGSLLGILLGILVLLFIVEAILFSLFFYGGILYVLYKAIKTIGQMLIHTETSKGPS